MVCAAKYTKMKAYRRDRGKAPSILNLDARLRCVVSFMLELFNPAYKHLGII
jgi:hypothetical protein